MSFESIGEFVAEARNLLDSIKGGAIRTMETQFEALKQQFNDKLSSTASELTSFVNQQKASVNGIFSEPDKRYQVLNSQIKKIIVGGSFEKWYPVVISGISGYGNTVSLTRAVHQDADRFGRWNGSLGLSMRVRASSASTYATVCLIDEYVSHGKGYGGDDEPRVLPDADVPFVGRVSATVEVNSLVIWLRGETTYNLSCDNGQANITVYDDGQPVPGTSLTPMNSADGVHPSIPSVGYVRGN